MDTDKCFIFQVHGNLTLVYKAPLVYEKGKRLVTLTNWF